MKRFFKWTAIAVSTAAGAALLYRGVAAARVRLARGLERAERIATDAQAAVARTEEALGETVQTVREIRQTLS
ncbi:MAG: hypothetical protein IT176_09740 [Acidobacteria bacterium]|nr:hypothetical protein [Acidobacteriota bacterium]